MSGSDNDYGKTLVGIADKLQFHLGEGALKIAAAGKDLRDIPGGITAKYLVKGTSVALTTVTTYDNSKSLDTNIARITGALGHSALTDLAATTLVASAVEAGWLPEGIAATGATVVAAIGLVIYADANDISLTEAGEDLYEGLKETLPELEEDLEIVANAAQDGFGLIEAARAETTEEDQPEEADKPIPDGEDVDKAYIDFMQSQIGLRDAINSGDSWDIAREGAGFVSGFDDYADALTNDDGFLDRSQEAVFDGIEHSIGLGQAIDDGDGWEIAGNSIDLINDIDNYVDANDGVADNDGGFIQGKGTAATTALMACGPYGWQQQWYCR